MTQSEHEVSSLYSLGPVSSFVWIRSVIIIIIRRRRRRRRIMFMVLSSCKALREFTLLT